MSSLQLLPPKETSHGWFSLDSVFWLTIYPVSLSLVILGGTADKTMRVVYFHKHSGVLNTCQHASELHLKKLYHNSNFHNPKAHL